MSRPFYWLALGVLAVWRVTHLLTAEAGPWHIFRRLRVRAGDGAFWGNLASCFYCLSLWVAAPVAYLLGEQRKERVLLWLALSGASILLERMTSPGEQILPAAYIEPAVYMEEKEEHVLR